MRARSMGSLFAVIATVGMLAAPVSAQPDDDDDDTPAAGDDDDGDGDGASGGEAPTPPTSAPPAADEINLEALRAEYLKLRDELFRSRARAATVASALYSSKIQINLTYATGRFYSVDRAVIRLDGANVFDDTDGTIAADKAPRFEGYIAPGRHQLSVRIEATGKDDQRFTSVIENTFVVQAPAGHDLIVKATAKDGGNIPYNWKRKQAGNYKLHLDVDVKSVKRAGSTKKSASKPRTPAKRPRKVAKRNAAVRK